jgi:hypothetical protein
MCGVLCVNNGRCLESHLSNSTCIIYTTLLKIKCEQLVLTWFHLALTLALPHTPPPDIVPYGLTPSGRSAPSRLPRSDPAHAAIIRSHIP